MSKEIKSSIIGLLKQDERFPDWWNGKEVEIPFFDNHPLQVVFMHFEPEQDKAFITEADQALRNFLKLSPMDRDAISELVHRNCMEFLAVVGFDGGNDHLRKIKRNDEIWNFVYPTTIYLTRRHRRDQDIYVFVACECDWEQEHGLQLVFRQGKQLTRISDQDGHLTEADAYDKPDEADELLSKFGNGSASC